MRYSLVILEGAHVLNALEAGEVGEFTRLQDLTEDQTAELDELFGGTFNLEHFHFDTQEERRAFISGMQTATPDECTEFKVEFYETSPSNKLSYQELSTVLAALRSWQDLGPKTKLALGVEHFHDCLPLTNTQIDEMAARLNMIELADKPSPVPVAYLRLHDMLSDLIEHGELKITNLDGFSMPNTYRALVDQLAGPCMAVGSQDVTGVPPKEFPHED